MEEDQEDMNELMKKHKAAVAQVTQPVEKPLRAVPNPRKYSFMNSQVINAEAYSMQGTLVEAVKRTGSEM